VLGKSLQLVEEVVAGAGIEPATQGFSVLYRGFAGLCAFLRGFAKWLVNSSLSLSVKGFILHRFARVRRNFSMQGSSKRFVLKHRRLGTSCELLASE
jgi:hypothetical protein